MAIIKRTWYASLPGGPQTRSIAGTEYADDLSHFRQYGHRVHEWIGEDREGAPLAVVWAPKTMLRLDSLTAYEITD